MNNADGFVLENLKFMKVSLISATPQLKCI